MPHPSCGTVFPCVCTGECWQTSGWSISDIPGVEWNASNFNLQQSLELLMKLGISPLFSFTVAPDEKNNTVNMLQVLYPTSVCHYLL